MDESLRAAAAQALRTPSPPPFDASVMAGPRLHHPNRDYLLFSGPLEAAMEMGQWPLPGWFIPQSRNLIWPSDRSWCVATEIDFTSTLVGGDSTLIDSVLADPALEAWPVGTGDDVANGDLINT